MRAAVKVGKERFELQEFPIPEIGPGECLIRVHACGICAWCYSVWLEDATSSNLPPGLSGHEVSGVVEHVGPGVTGWKPGDRVVIHDLKGCGECAYCREGKETYCRKARGVNRGYADYLAISSDCLLPAPKGMDLALASLLTDMVGTPMHAIRRAFAVNISHTVSVVWGLGPIGMFTVQGLRTFEGVEKIMAIDPHPMHRELALQLGADVALDPKAPDTEERLMAENEGRGANYAFNCALNTPEAIDVAFRTLKLDGYLMNLLGRALSGYLTEKRVDSSWYFFRNEYPENVRLVQEGKIKLEPVLTHVVPAERINEAMELRAKRRGESLKVVTTWCD
jgi:threonine dehydrogenase-like Zn-dependent dehydrogenase